MGEPGVPTAEQYCGKVLPEGGKLGLCGLTASCGLVRSLQKELDAKKGTIKLLNLEDELWTEGRPAPVSYTHLPVGQGEGTYRTRRSPCTSASAGKFTEAKAS